MAEKAPKPNGKEVPEETPADKETERQTFDQALTEQFRKHIHDAISAHPELRSVAVVFDYGGNLNDANVLKGVWQGEKGPVSDIPSVMGSITNGMAILSHQTQRLGQINKALQDDLIAVSRTLIQRRQELGVLDQQQEADTGNDASPAEDREVGSDSGR
jgi:hypothetical protein